MYVLIVSARVKPEQRGRFLEAIEENAVSSVRDEGGCLRFDVVRDPREVRRRMGAVLSDGRSLYWTQGPDLFRRDRFPGSPPPRGR